MGTDWLIIMVSRNREVNAPQSVGRPREFDEADVLDKVMTLFWRQGYEGTGLKDIQMTTGLAKGSIYKAFESKHKLYLKSLQRYEALHVDTAVEALTSSEQPMIRLNDFLSAPIHNLSTSGRNKGCFLCNASTDRADSDDDTRALVQRSFKKLGQALAVVISEHKTDWTHEQIQQGAQMMLAIYSGLRTMSRSGYDVVALTQAKDAALMLMK